MEKLNNPFFTLGFLGPEYFCGREQELRILKEHFDNERNVVIYSWRRLGKTALIRRFEWYLEKEKGTAVVYADLFGVTDIQAAIRQITQAVYDRFGHISGGFSDIFRQLLGVLGIELSFDALSGQPKFNIGFRQLAQPEKSLHALGKFLESRGIQVLIILDEFQQITDFTDCNGEAVFRGWMQSFPSLRFIFSGSHRHMMLSMFASKNRPFYRSVQLLLLNPIPLDVYTIFIKGHFNAHGKTIDDDVVKAVYDWSRGQTYSVQLVCNYLFATHTHVSIANLPSVFKAIIEQESPFFTSYSKLLTKTQWKLFVAVAHAEPLRNPYAREFADAYRLGAGSTVATAMKMLIKSELVIEEDGSYLVHDVLLARWLQTL